MIYKTVEVFVKLNSKTTKVIGVENGVLKVFLKEKPVDGAANKALVEVLSVYYSVPKSKIEIVKGLTYRRKVIVICV